MMLGVKNARAIAAFIAAALALNAAVVWGEATNSDTSVGTGGSISKSRVVLVRDPSAVTGFTADASKVRAMVTTGMKTLTGQADNAAAWRMFASSNDVVGIKINTQGAPLQATRPAVVDAIVDGLRSAGVNPTNIVVWDRDATKMRAAGYATVGQASRPPSFRVLSIIPDTGLPRSERGWDPETFYESKLVGKLIWGDLLFGKEDSALSTRSHLPKLLTQTITKLINVPVLQDNDACGLAGCLYNISVNAVDNNRRFEMFGQKGDPSIPAICAMPVIRRKLVLNICDALIGGYAGGPNFKPQFSWPYGGLYFSRDPVAIDTTCLKLLETKRAEAKVTPIGTLASHITTAGEAGLGQAKPDHIDLIETAP
jgi:uncharacterized protein (DUF362 family)